MKKETLTPISREDLQSLEDDINAAVIPTAGYVATLELNCTDSGDEIVTRLVHSTGQILGDASFNVDSTDSMDSLYDACEDSVFSILQEARTTFRQYVLREILALHDFNALIEALAIIRNADIPWGWTEGETAEGETKNQGQGQA